MPAASFGNLISPDATQMRTATSVRAAHLVADLADSATDAGERRRMLGIVRSCPLLALTESFRFVHNLTRYHVPH